jgi:hypothetical protein
VSATTSAHTRCVPPVRVSSDAPRISYGFARSTMTCTHRIVQLQQCANTCGRVLRNALSCKANCPYLTLINSHFALVLPLWLRTFPCDHLLLLDRTVSGQPHAHASASILFGGLHTA